MNTTDLKTLRSNNLAKINMGNKRTHKFNVDFSDISPEFIGTFTVHYPSQLERLQIGVIKSSLLGGVNVDITTDNIAHILATLDVVLDQKPEWFNADNPELDYDIMEKVFVEYIEWSNSFRKKPSNGTGDSEGHSEDRGC